MKNLYKLRMFHFGQKLACRLPRWLVILIAQCLAFERYTCAKQEKAWLRKNLRYCGQADDGLNVFRVIRNYAVCIADVLRIPVSENKKLADTIIVRGRDNLDRALTMNQGVILVAGHIGNWDLAGVYLSGQGYPLCAVTENIPGLGGFFNSLREKNGMQTFFPYEKDKISQALHNKKILALLADRDFTGWGVTVKFLKGEKILPIGPSVLAIKNNSPIVVGNITLAPDKNSYAIEISEPILPHNKTIKELSQLIADKLSRYIRQNPFQWFVLRDEWLG